MVISASSKVLRRVAAGSWLACVLCIARSAAADTVWVDALDLSMAHGTARVNQSATGAVLTVNGKAFDHGVGTTTGSSLAIRLQGAATRFSASVGIDDDAKGAGAAVFRLEDDKGRGLWESSRVVAKTDPTPVELDLSGVGTLFLLTSDPNGAFSTDAGAGDAGISGAHGDWLNAAIEFGGAAPQVVTLTPPPLSVEYVDRVWIKVDDTVAAATYNGTWSLSTTDPSYRGTLHVATATGSTVDFPFVGTQARYYGAQRSDQGRVRVYVDGAPQTVLNANATVATYDTVLFESSELPYGSHTLTVETVTTKVAVDAFAYRTPATPWDREPVDGGQGAGGSASTSSSLLDSGALGGGGFGGAGSGGGHPTSGSGGDSKMGGGCHAAAQSSSPVWISVAALALIAVLTNVRRSGKKNRVMGPS